MANSLRLIGGRGDLANLPQRLQDEGIDVRLPDVIHDTDYVAFCISCTDGPTPATSQAVELCAGRTVAAVAIVLTNYALLVDDSLRELVTVEERALLTRILPGEIIERLPVYYDFDPGLAQRLLNRMNKETPSVMCLGTRRVN